MIKYSILEKLKKHTVLNNKINTNQKESQIL
jgi:hypothetical protein